LEAHHGEKLREWLIEGKEVKSVSQERAEKDARRQELVKYFADVRGKNEAWFTNKEIKANRKISEWDLDSLEKLYAMLNKPKEETVKPEETKADGEVKDYREIHILVNEYPACKKLCDEYLGKMKCELADLKPAQLKVLTEMLQVRAKSDKKEEQPA
jgi:hypothetical protein